MLDLKKKLEDELAALVTRDAMIGVANVSPPRKTQEKEEKK